MLTKKLLLWVCHTFVVASTILPCLNNSLELLLSLYLPLTHKKCHVCFFYSFFLYILLSIRRRKLFSVQVSGRGKCKHPKQMKDKRGRHYQRQWLKAFLWFTRIHLSSDGAVSRWSLGSSQATTNNVRDFIIIFLKNTHIFIWTVMSNWMLKCKIVFVPGVFKWGILICRHTTQLTLRQFWFHLSEELFWFTWIHKSLMQTFKIRYLHHQFFLI